MNEPTPRLTAAVCLVKILRDKAYSNLVLEHTLSGVKMSDPDRALCHAIVQTALERRMTLDFILSMFVKVRPDETALALLYTGLSQIFYFDKIPVSAACDETVKAAKALTDSRRAGFINAALRSACRRKDEVCQRIENAPDSVRWSLDDSICDLIRREYPEQATTIFNAFFRPEPLCLRVNTQKCDAETLCRRLNMLGCDCELEEEAVFVFTKPYAALSLLPEGSFYVQGAPSQYAGKLLTVKSGMTVVDSCACPGGKTFSAAIDLEGTGKVYAFDLHANKLSLIQKGAETLGLMNIECREHDGRKILPELKEQADRVICDVPCSALGVIASRPEIRYKDINNQKALYETQKQILNASSGYLKHGGLMVYSTCTIDPRENTEQIEAFLSNHLDFTRGKEKLFLPDEHLPDGFYAVQLIRN